MFDSARPTTEEISMATAIVSTQRTVDVEDVVGVRSRISWAAILGGSVISIAAYLVFTFFLAAVGLSLTEAGVRGNAVGIGAIVAAVIAMAASLFLGGWVTTQLTVGENRQESAIYGVLTWAVVTGFTLVMVGMGVRAGYLALVGSTLVAQQSPAVQQRSWQDLARDAGVSQQKIDEAKAATDPNRVQAQLNDPATQEKLREGGMIASWAVFAGTLLSIGMAVFGGMVGRGATFRLFAANVHQRQEIIRP
jgi:hypothetical protein